MRPIDADALLEKMQRTSRYFRVVYDVDAMPTLHVAPVRHGRWVTQDETRTKFMCSLCESKNYGGHEKFCPNCGARMDGGDSDAKSV